MNYQDILKNSMVPKIERTIPSTVELTQTMLPAIQDWAVGKRYLLRLEVESVGQELGDLEDPNVPREIVNKFRILSAQALQPEDTNLPHNGTPQSAIKDAYMRAAVKVIENNDGR